jgi:hypothetical protein
MKAKKTATAEVAELRAEIRQLRMSVDAQRNEILSRDIQIQALVELHHATLRRYTS